MIVPTSPGGIGTIPSSMREDVDTMSLPGRSSHMKELFSHERKLSLYPSRIDIRSILGSTWGSRIYRAPAHNGPGICVSDRRSCHPSRIHTIDIHTWVLQAKVYRRGLRRISWSLDPRSDIVPGRGLLGLCTHSISSLSRPKLLYGILRALASSRMSCDCRRKS